LAISLGAEALKHEAERKALKDYPRMLVLKNVFAGAGKKVWDEKFFKTNQKEYKMPFDAFRVCTTQVHAGSYIMINKNVKLQFPISSYAYSVPKFVVPVWEIELVSGGAYTIWVILEKTK